ncbi:MAG: maltose alpha-D-glucosyltransferase [Desulfotomaculales bacterium]
MASDNNGLWYKDAVIYEVHVRAFYDGNGDGIGDFCGLTEKLDYLQDLGVTAVWLLPFYPSPLKDDGYDIADYTGVHPAYGSLRDLKRFLREAHRRGLKVITELVCNHTSDQHPWFQRARRACPGSAWRNFYVWSQTPDRYKEARVIFKDFETSNWSWDPVAGAYYWHRFFFHQPDLNYDNPLVRRAIFRVVDFWLGLGVDGLRLDAVPYLYEREGTTCENLPETHAFLKELRRHVDARFPHRMLLAEANQWPEHAAAYFGDGDECHMAFHFPLMPRLFLAIRTEDRSPIVDILLQTPAIPDNAQWALFLRNHDELTLEMVSDEERDYMYRVYAQDPQMRVNLGIRRRLAPLLGNHRRRIELMNGLLFSLPGTPVIYYGDEIGMGDNIYLGDRNAVRTPMQWSADRNAGFSTANRQRLYLPVIVDPEYHYEAVNVEAQQNNPHSLLWWMKRLIALRKRYRAFGRGALELLHPENRKVLAFLRRYENELLLVVANLSRFVQYAELDLSAFKGMVPVEIFGRVRFPAIADRPYFITLGPHDFYWFSLEPPHGHRECIEVHTGRPEIPIPVIEGPAETLFRENGARALAEILPSYLHSRPWFEGRGRQIKGAGVAETVPVPQGAGVAHVLLVRVEYTEGDPETYVLPLAQAAGPWAEQIRRQTPQAVVAEWRGKDKEGVLYDALYEPGFCRALLEAIVRHRRFRGARGALVAAPTRAFRAPRRATGPLPEATAVEDHRTGTLVAFGDRLTLKVFRRVEEGINPELELGCFLLEKTAFCDLAPVLGSLAYRSGSGAPLTLGVLRESVAHQGDAWQYTLGALHGYFERVAQLPPPEVPPGHLLHLAGEDPPAAVRELVGGYLEAARRLGRQTAELHLALCSEREDPDFAPEAFTPLYQRAVYHSMRTLAGRVLGNLRRECAALPAPLREEARAILDRQEEIYNRFRRVLEGKITALRTRCHGDYRLERLLYGGQRFILADFEGEAGRSLCERRLKRSPLRDVAGMLLSLYSAVYRFLQERTARGMRPADPEPWARLWYSWVATTFLREYLGAATRAPFLPETSEELAALLDAYLLEQALARLGSTPAAEPERARAALKAILEVLEGRFSGPAGAGPAA